MRFSKKKKCDNENGLVALVGWERAHGMGVEVPDEFTATALASEQRRRRQLPLIPSATQRGIAAVLQLLVSTRD